jgi:hypothetical protein
VSREPNDPSGPTFNLFTPSPLLTMKPMPGTPMPETWDRLLDNIAGQREKQWLVNHMATYVQTLKKPRTIPILLGKQGTGLRQRLLLSLVSHDRLHTDDLQALLGLMGRTFSARKLATGLLARLNPLAA